MPSPGDTRNPAGALGAAILRLLRPLVRLLLRYGIAYGAFADLAKRVYVEVARDEFALPGRKQSVSRVSIITGLSRKEVRRVADLERPDDAATAQRYNRAARVIGGWLRDPDFTAGGEPRALRVDDEFAELAKRYSGDVPPRALLDELLRVDAVATDGAGRVTLNARAYVPRSGEADKLEILGADVADLISTIDHNLTASPDRAFFQRKVSYDNLPVEGTEALRDVASRRSQSLLEELDRWMSAHDRDTSPSIVGRGRKRAVLGIYYYEEALSEDDE